MRVALLLAGAWAAPAMAQQRDTSMQMDAPICRDAPPQHAVSQGDGVIELDWQDTVCLEHADRAIRMARLAERLGLPDRPIVTQYLLDRRLLPPAFRGDVPLLRIVFPERSFFDTARSEIRPEALDALRLIAESLRREVPDVAVFVAGHTDDRGGEDHNHNLSVARANAVAAELNQIGVGGVALWRVGFGEAVPLRPNDSPENMAVNRRVEFILGARAEAVATWLAQQQPDLCTERGDSGRCLRRPLARRLFVAEPVTRALGLAAPRTVRIAAPARERRTVDSLVGPRPSIGPPPRARIVIDLTIRMHRVDTLDPL